MMKLSLHQISLGLLFFIHLLFFAQVYAGPAGGSITGGSGSINQSGSTTTIQQNTRSLAIDWNSFNINKNETVNFLQPSASSIALNRILSQNGSQILGQINANGQVVLVNPNGIFFGQSATVNVGGLIASGLDISKADFMNGDYIFNQLSETDGIVFNSGLLTASLGGNITLLGKQVTNDGVISANLGRVNLVAGEAAVLTFDQQGLLGVQVTEAVLQNDLSVDPALLNSGEVNAEGGQVLLTASVSQDVFSQAVNTGGIEQASSVVVNEDGSFTLGAGADVVNDGMVDVSSSDTNQNGGQVVILGENVTNSGIVKADAAQGNGGDVEVHSRDVLLMSGQASISAQSTGNGHGGNIKLLGDKVGLLDSTSVNSSGMFGGGEILIGGDYQGANSNIHNAINTFVDKDSIISNNAITQGNAGKTIIWADKTTGFLGKVNARGGQLKGDGGFIEISGKDQLVYRGNTDRSATNGDSGSLLLDPWNITIQASGSSDGLFHDSIDLPLVREILFGDVVTTSITISASQIQTELETGDVLLQANRDIDVNSPITATANNVHGLTLQASDDVTVSAGIDLKGGDLTLIAGSTGCSSCPTGTKRIRVGATLQTTGSIKLIAADYIEIRQPIGDSTNADSIALSPASVTLRAGDSILIDSTGNNGSITTNNGTVSLTASDSSLKVDPDGSGPELALTVAPDSDPVAGTIFIEGNVNTNGGKFTATTTVGHFDNDFVDGKSISTGSGDIEITTGGAHAGGYGAFLGGLISTGTLSVTTTGGTIVQQPLASNRPNNRILVNNAVFDTGTDSITLDRVDNNFSGTVSLTASTVSITDVDSIELGDVSISGAGSALTVTALGSGDISQAAGTTISVNTSGAITSLTASDNAVNLNDGGLTTTNDFNQITVSAASTSIADVNAIQLNAFNITGADATTLEVFAGGEVSQGGILDNSGANALTLINAPGQTVTFTNTSNDFTHFSVNALTADIVDTNSIAIGTSTITGSGTSLKITADGNSSNISQVAGSTITNNQVGAITDLIATGDDASLNESANDFTQINVSAASSSIQDVDDIDLGQITLTGSGGITFDLTAGGAVNQASGDNIDNNGIGAITRVIAIGQTINLINDTNDFTTIELSGLNVDVHDSGSIDLGTSTITGTFDVSSLGAGNITQSAAVSVTGQTTLHASGDDITLADDLNDFSSVNFDGANNVDIHDTNSIILDAATGLATLNITTLGNGPDTNGITQTGALGVTGTSSFNATGGQIIIVQSNTFSGDVSLNNSGDNNVEITNSGLLTFSNSALGDGTFTVNNTGGNIQQSGFITQNTNGSLVTLDAGNNDITLLSNNNDFVGALSLTANQASITDTNSVQLGDSTINGSGLIITARSGDISQLLTGNGLDITGTASFTSIDGYISLANSNNDFKNDVDLTTSGNDGSTTLSEISDINDLTLTTANINSSSGGLTANATQINLNADVTSSDGSVTFNAPVVLTRALTTINSGIGNISFTGAVDGTTARSQDLTMSSADVDFQGAVGGSTRLGDLSISSTGFVTATSISANSLDVTQSSSFTTTGAIDTAGAATGSSGGDVSITAAAGTITTDSIDTHGVSPAAGDSPGLNGGAITLDAADIEVGVLTSSGSNAIGAGDSIGGTAGAITLSATDNTLSGTPSVTLNGDVIALGGTGVGIGGAGGNQIAQLTLGGSSDPDGAVILNHTSGFTSGLNITGVNDASQTNGSDTLSALGTSNIWDIDNTNSGTLNSIITFSNFENLTGGGLADTFNFIVTTTTGSLKGLIDGGSGSGTDTLNLFTGEGTTTANTTVRLIATGDTSNTELEVTDVEEVHGNAMDNNTLIGSNNTTNWFINGAYSGSLGGATVTTVTSLPTEGQVIFTNFKFLTGGSAADTFNIVSTDISTGLLTLNGGASANSSMYDTLVGPDADTTWTVNSQNGGTLVNSENTAVINVEFSDIENLQAGSGDDTFSFLDGLDVDGWVDGGSHNLGDNDTVDLRYQTVVVFNMADGISGWSNFESVNGNWNSTNSTGNSTIRGDNVENNWQITGDNSGSVGTFNFTNFNNLTGGTDTDIFTFSDSGEIDGLINGNGNTGAGIESIDLTAKTSAVTVEVSNVANQNNNGILEFYGIEQIDANATYENQIISDSMAAVNNWNINGPNTGTLNSTLSFNNFSQLTGVDDVNDDFIITNAGSISGSLEGGAGTGTDTLTGRATTNNWIIDTATTGHITGTGFVNSFSSIESLVGNTGQDIFTLLAGVTYNGSMDGAGGTTDRLIAGDNAINNFAITTANGGTVTGLSQTFSNIEELVGNSQVDHFVLSNSGSISGSIQGSTGTDTLTANSTTNNWFVDTATSGHITGTGFVNSFSSIESLLGNTGQDIFTLLTGVTFSGSMDGAGGTTDRLIAGDNAINNFAITTANGGTVTGLSQTFSNIEELVGNSQVDHFVLSNSGSISGSIQGSTGTDTLTANSTTNNWFVDTATIGHITGTGFVNSFSSIESLVGNTGQDIFTLLAGVTYNGSMDGAGGALDQLIAGDNALNNFTISSATTGTVTGLTSSFSNIEELTGNSQQDIFSLLTGITYTGSVNGAGGTTDRLIAGDNAINNFAITTANGGTVTGLSQTFSNIEELVGNSQVDHFVLSNSGSISGSIQGSTGTDTLTANSTTNNWFVDTATIGHITGTGFVNSFSSIESLVGNTGQDIFTLLAGVTYNGSMDGAGGTTDRLIAGDNAINNFAITTANGGTVTGLSQTFSNIEELVGNSQVDHFVLSNSGSISGSIQGSTGTDTLTANSTTNNWFVDTATSGHITGTGFVNSFSSIESLLGNTGQDIFTLLTGVTFSGSMDGAGGTTDRLIAGDNAINNFAITTANGGTVTGLSQTFSNIEELVGNSQVDHFVLSNSGSISGSIQGSTGTDTLTANSTTNNWFVDTATIGHITGTGFVNSFSSIESLVGNTGQDIFTLLAGVTYNGSMDGAGGTTDRLIAGDNAINNFAITTANGGTVTGLSQIFSNIEELVGNSQVDHFVLSNSGSISGSIQGSTGTDTLTANSTTNNWFVDTATIGHITGTSFVNSFSSIESLVGNTGQDIFTLLAGVTYNGSMDGAGGTTDRLIAGDNAINNFAITTANGGTVTGLSQTFSNIEELVGNSQVDHFVLSNSGSISGSIQGSTGTDTLTANSTTNNWFVDTATSGHITGTGFVNSFSSIESLVGNTGQDIFTLLTGVTYNGSMDGAGGALDQLIAGDNALNNFTISSATTGTVTGLTSSFSNIEELTGNSQQDIFSLLTGITYTGSVNGAGGTTDRLIAGDNAINNFAITTANGGTVTGLSQTFSNIEELVGNSQVDHFVLSNSGSISGSIQGSTGTDTLTANSTTNNWFVDTATIGHITGTGFVNSFSSIESLVGNTGQDIFTLLAGVTYNGSMDGAGGTTDRLIAGDNAINNFAITTANGGTVTGLSQTFSNIEELVGNSQVDHFVLNGGSLSGLIDGSDGMDSLTADAVDNTWAVDGPDSGSVTADVSLNQVAFQNVESLIGSTGTDTFNFGVNGEVSGNIDGVSGIDTLDLTAKNSDITVKLGQAFVANAANTFNIENFEFVKGADTKQNNIDSTIIGADVDQLWIINASYGGAVGAVLLVNDVYDAAGEEGVTIFSGFKNVQGGDADDSFRVATGTFDIPSMDGGSQVIGDTIDLSLQDSVSITIGSNSNPGSTNTIGIEGYRGNNTNSILIASNVDNLWTISGENDGTVEYGNGANAESFAFTDFNILRGGNRDDTFVVESGGSVQGISTNGDSILTGIYAGDGDDTLTVNFAGNENGAVALFDGEAGSNTVTFQNTAGGIGFDQAVYTPVTNNVQATHSFENYANGALVNGYSVTYQNATNAVNDNVSADILMINGTSVGDNLVLEASSFQVSSGAVNFTTVGYTGKNSIVINGGNGSDSIELTSPIDLGINDLTISAESIINDNTDLITANTLTLDTLSSLSSTLRTNVVNLSITNSTDSNAVLNIDEQNDIVLNNLGLVGRLNLTADGAITQNSPLASNASINLISTPSTGFIDLSLSGNALTGPLRFTTAGVVDLDNTVVTNLAGVASSSLSVVTNNQDIFGSGNILVSSAEFNAGTTGSIQLDSAGNDFGVITILSAETVIIRDSNDIQLGNINMGTAGGTGLFSLTSTGVSQQSGAAFTQQAGPGLTAGQVTFDAGAGSIALNGANQFIGEVSLNNTGNHAVSINDVDNLVFTDSTIGSGMFTVTAGSGVSQTGFITQEIGAAVNINAGAGAIDLSHAENDFSGPISLSNSGQNDVDFTNTNAINIASATVGGALNMLSTGSYDITQTGVINVAGLASFSVNSGQSILLPLVDGVGNPTNHFQQAVTLTTHNGGSLQDVRVSNDSALDLSLSDISGGLQIVTSGAVTETGSWTVSGDTVIDSNGSNVTLTNNLNNFNQIAFVDAQDVTLIDRDGIVLGTATDSNGINGNLRVTTLSEGITQNSNSFIRADGVTTLNAASGAGNINLGSTNNNFNIVNVTSAQNVTLVDTNEITLNANTINGDLDLTAGGSIDDGDVGLSVTGLTSFTTGTGANITLDNTGNELSGLIRLGTSSPGSLGNVVVTNNLNTDLGGVEANNLSIYSAGNITQQGGFAVNNETHLSANSTGFGPQDIVLSGVASNSLNQLWVENAHDVIIDNSGADLTINQMNASGLIDITSRDLTSNSAISANGVNFNTSGSAVYNYNVNSTAGIEIVAGDLQLNSQIIAVNDLLLTTVTSDINQNGSLSSSMGNIILESAGNISMDGAASTSTSNGDVFYSAEDNIGLGFISAQNHSISLNSTNGSIGDLNREATNLRANSLTVRSLTGIASESNKLDTQVALMDIENTGDGSIFIEQTGNVEIVKLQSTASGREIFFESNADVTVNKGSVAVNRDSGKLRMNSDHGSFYGESNIDYSQPNITANTATFFVVNGTFGSTSKPIVFDVPKTGSVFIDAKTNSILFYPEKPDDLITTGIDISSLGVIQAISGEQLVEIESLGDIDPAIFTELRNYSSVDISIRMPRDQLYEDELEEEDKKDAEQVSLAF